MAFTITSNTYSTKTSTSSSHSDINELPNTLIYSVSVCLTGLYLISLPISPLKKWGEKLVVTGATSSGMIIATHMDKKKQDRKKEDKHEKKQQSKKT